MPPEPASLSALQDGGLALVLGAQGSLGAALAHELELRHPGATVWRLGRASQPPVDLQDESTLAQAADAVARHTASGGPGLRVLVLATGFLHGDGLGPERRWDQIDAAYLAQAFAINAIGPALVVKHFFSRLARKGPVLAVFLSARVGSIGDNKLGGWYGYRASKAALNQVVRTAAIELGRHNPQAMCVAMHPGTVQSALSAPFSKAGLQVREPGTAAAEIVDVLAGLDANHTGSFVAWDGRSVPW